MLIIIWSNKTTVNLWLPWLQEHGNSKRILRQMLMVKLLDIINVNSQKSFTGLWTYMKMMHGFILGFFLFPFWALDWCLFPGIVFDHLWSFAFSRKYDVRAGASADAGRARHMCLASLLRSFFIIIYRLSVHVYIFIYVYVYINIERI